MKFEHIALAAALALAPVASQAVTVVSAGGSYEITNGADAFIGEVDAAGGAGSYSVNFFTALDPLNAFASATVGLIVAGTFSDLTVSWISTATNTVLATAPVTVPTTTLATLFSSPDNLSQDLVFSWTDSTDGAGFDFEVSAVPLPAAGWLFASALVGMGLLSRRRENA